MGMDFLFPALNHSAQVYWFELTDDTELETI